MPVWSLALLRDEGTSLGANKRANKSRSFRLVGQS
jgi:hypothetical protein